MNLPEFIFSTDVYYALFGYGIVLLPTVAWVYFSSQEMVAKSIYTVIAIAIRLVVVFLIVFFVSWYASIATWVLVAGILILIGIGAMMDIPFSGIVSFALLYIVQQFVLGFPARHEWMLAPHTETDSQNELQEKHRELIGSFGWTVSPLRPLGEVDIDGTLYQAAANNGILIAEQTRVKVIRVRNGTLMVRQSSEEDSAIKT